MSPNSTRNRGFTLVELLVVIAVIALLAALLLPALAGAKEAARTAFCKNNIRQLLIATRLYTDDYHAYPNGNTWQGSVELYIGQTHHRFPNANVNSVWACPSYVGLHGVFDNTVWLSPSGVPQGRLSSTGAYGYNDEGVEAVGGGKYPAGLGPGLGLGGDGLPPRTATREEEVLKPSALTAFGDAPLGAGQNPVSITADIVCGGMADLAGGIGRVQFTDSSGTHGGLTTGQGPDQIVANKATQRRHNGRFNIGFADSHIELMRPADIFDRRRDDEMRLWNRDNESHREVLGP